MEDGTQPPIAVRERDRAERASWHEMSDLPFPAVLDWKFRISSAVAPPPPVYTS